MCARLADVLHKSRVVPPSSNRRQFFDTYDVDPLRRTHDLVAGDLSARFGYHLSSPHQGRPVGSKWRNGRGLIKFSPSEFVAQVGCLVNEFRAEGLAKDNLLKYDCPRALHNTTAWYLLILPFNNHPTISINQTANPNPLTRKSAIKLSFHQTHLQVLDSDPSNDFPIFSGSNDRDGHPRITTDVCAIHLLFNATGFNFRLAVHLQNLARASNPKSGYFEYPCVSRTPARARLARAGAGLVAVICVILTSIELVHVYQASVVHPWDLTYFQRTPWTFALIPVLTAIVNAISQIYFSSKACRNHLNMRFITVLGLLGVISLIGGVSSSIAMVVRLSQKLHSHGTPVAEKLFRAYLVTSTISSGLISFLLLCSSMKQSELARRESLRNAAVKFERHTIQSMVNFLLSTYTLVFVLEISSIICASASLSSNFTVALHPVKPSSSCKGLQSALWHYRSCMPSSTRVRSFLAKVSPRLSHSKRSMTRTPKMDDKRSRNKTSLLPDPTDPKPLSSEEDEEFDELFVDTFPSEGIPMTQDETVTDNTWPLAKRISASLSLPEKALGEFASLPGRSSSLFVRQKPPTLSSMRSLQLTTDTSKQLPTASPRTKKSGSKSKRHQSQLKYIISSPIAQKQTVAYNEFQEESLILA
ncbi:hypothetical protein Pst134EA_032993 [Puccinia striiformis f. sp. tritici]|uniref:uncharacterized protein n=1 Tax=Puccinia striiformis f. sp. tritici TaxID=168172 RepID=UPI0020077CD7|nr:uncharacterized protein Pst134EA_032993 [Puccinia striiformis f. sp. tritici]KAH9440838.1 hypothetical protein Pst134EA_032993 [Puccinia striiformis f. sp. tritici]